VNETATPAKDFAEVAAVCRQLVLNDAAAITGELIEHAMTNAQAAKFLFEFAGLMQPPAPAADAPHPGEQLIAELKRVLEEERGGPPVE
jgi:hypothetical protein